MANASNGEPLSYRHAVLLWSAQSVLGTAVTPATSAGQVDGELIKGSDNRFFFGPGSANFAVAKGGMATNELNLTFKAIQNGGSKSLLLRAVRSSGALPLTTLGIGYQDDVTPTPNRSASQLRDCKVNTLTLNYEAGTTHNPLTATLGFIGQLDTTITSLSPAALTAKPYMSYETVMTEEGTGYEVRSLTVNVAHNLRRDAVIPGATPSTAKRFHKYLTEGNEVITGSISRFVPSGQSVHADTLSERDLVLTATNLDDATTLALTLTNCIYDNERTQVSEEGILYTFDFQAQTFGLA